MPYRLVKGEFQLFYQGQTRRVGSEPDGDTIWFKPKSKKRLENVDGRDAEIRGNGYASLRLEGIDALELHFSADHHQHIGLALAARDSALDSLGFDSVSYSGSKGTTVAAATPHPISGYILTKSIDPYGRPVSFAFAGSSNEADGSEVFLDTTLLGKSVNAKLARAGHAYPTFYSGLPTDLRNRIADLADAAYGAGDGLWRDEEGMDGASVPNLAQLEKRVIWPKLFRRLVSYFQDGNSGVAGFDAWLRADSKRDDKLWIIPLAEFGNLHDVVEVSGNTIAMKYWSEELVIVPR